MSRVVSTLPGTPNSPGRTNARPPGPKGNFFFGNVLEFHRDNLAFYTRCARDFGDVVSYRLGIKRIIQVNHPDLIEEVLVSRHRNFVKGYSHRLLEPVLGKGLLTSEGDYWLRQRRLIQPAFVRSRLAGYAETMVAFTERLIAGWQDGGTRDLHADMVHLGREIVCKALFDVDVSDRVQDVGAAFEVILHNFSRLFNSPIVLPAWFPTPAGLRVGRVIRRLDSFLHGIIQERRASGQDRGDLLSLLLRARDEDDGSGMTDRQMRDELMTLFLAGHETTALALSWTWYLLAQYPEVEARLHAELQEVLGARAPTAPDVPNLRYAEKVVMESMRLYPPAYGFSREAVRDCQLGGYRIKAGATIFLLQWVVHRDPRYFENPDRFVPERWTPEFIQRLPKFAYFPFGGGPRLCVGNTFAMMQAVLVLATIARKFRFTLVPDHPVQPWPSVTLRPKSGIQVSVARRPPVGSDP